MSYHSEQEALIILLVIGMVGIGIFWVYCFTEVTNVEQVDEIDTSRNGYTVEYEYSTAHYVYDYDINNKRILIGTEGYDNYYKICVHLVKSGEVEIMYKGERIYITTATAGTHEYIIKQTDSKINKNMTFVVNIRN